ncbi:hypothetical protein ACFYTS_35525 [Nocardia sp. NPDC004151]|uniref:hypothetical protein n=1 Tax=Nocardia sp. NPDC004151 TaxID=3364304 RepID=UPI0036C2CF89
MTIGAELSGRVTTGVQQAVLGRLNEPFSVGALSVVSAMQALPRETSMTAAVKELPPAMPAMQALAREASTAAFSVSSAMQDVARQLSFAPEISVASAMQALPRETSMTAAVRELAPAMPAMQALASEASTAAFSASSVLQDAAKQLSSTVSTMDMGRFAATLQPDLALQSAVRAYQPDLSAPFLTLELPNAWKEFGDKLQSVSNVWKEFGDKLQNVWKDLKDQLRGGVSSLLVNIQALREAAARREVLSRVIRFRQRSKAWISGAHTAARIRSEDKQREAFLRALAAKRAEIAYGRARLAHREVGCMPPGRLVVARPRRTRGPNSCKSIRTHRLAGLLRT